MSNDDVELEKRMEKDNVEFERKISLGRKAKEIIRKQNF